MKNVLALAVGLSAISCSGDSRQLNLSRAVASARRLDSPPRDEEISALVRNEFAHCFVGLAQQAQECVPLFKEDDDEEADTCLTPALAGWLMCLVYAQPALTPSQCLGELRGSIIACDTLFWPPNTPFKQLHFDMCRSEARQMFVRCIKPSAPDAPKKKPHIRRGLG